MKQLKHRIAIGKLENGEWKFDHYATPEEMAELKPKADGSGVEKLRLSIHKAMVDGEFLATRIGIGHGKEIKLYGLWQDVSDTHRLEWGIETNDKHCNPLDIYDGDIFVDWNTGADGISTMPIKFELLTCAESVSSDEFPMIEILGNVNENPELLEAGK